MTDTYYDKRPVQRRTLALVAVLALCMVSLTSVAYAYSTTVSIEDNPIADHYYTIDYTNGLGTPLMVPLAMNSADDEIVITTAVSHGAVSGNVYTDKTVTATINANTFTRTFYVEFNADEDAEDKAFTISVDVTLDSVLEKFISYDPSSVTYKVDNGVVVPTAIHKGDIVEVTLTMTIEDPVDVSTLGLQADVDPDDLVTTLGAVKTELATHTFDVVVSVTPTPVTP